MKEPTTFDLILTAIAVIAGASIFIHLIVWAISKKDTFLLSLIVLAICVLLIGINK